MVCIRIYPCNNLQVMYCTAPYRSSLVQSLIYDVNNVDELTLFSDGMTYVENMKLVHTFIYKTYAEISFDHTKITSVWDVSSDDRKQLRQITTKSVGQKHRYFFTFLNIQVWLHVISSKLIVDRYFIAIYFKENLWLIPAGANFWKVCPLWRL